MKVVKPYEWTTVCLDPNTHFIFEVITAKAVFYHILKGHGQGIDANGFYFNYEDMQRRKITLYPDHPVMRSAPNFMTGEETAWPLPTVFLPNKKYFYKNNKQYTEDTLPSVREVFNFYRGVCQRCLRPIKKMDDASRDHWKPKALGGGNGITNITLMHKDCNSALGHSFPKFNANGEEIIPKMKLYANHFMMPDIPIRPEWKSYLFV